MMNGWSFQSLWQRLAAVFAMAAVYYLTGKLGLMTAIPPAGAATAVWPPSGISLAALLRFGNVVTPGIWLGSFVLNVVSLRSSTPADLVTFVTAMAAIATGSTLQAMLGAYLVRRFADSGDAFYRPLSCIRFVAVAAMACTVASTVGALSLCLGGLAPWKQYPMTWLTWWTGDAVGVLLLAPLCLLWIKPGQVLPRTWESLEVAALAVATLLGSLTVFTHHLGLGLGISSTSFTFALLPIVLWAAIRFGPRGVVVVILVISAIAFSTVLDALHRFPEAPVHGALTLTQAFLGVATITGLIVAAAFEERRHLQSQLQDRLADLKRTNHELNRFTWVASHDLQEPLRTVTTYSQLLERKIRSEKRADLEELLHYLITSSRRLKTLVDNLLAYSRLERSPRNFTSVNSATLVSDALANLKALTDESQAHVTVGGLPQVIGDPALLTVVFQNLLSNAIKFRRADTIPHIEVKASRLPGAWEFQVRDDGIGIEKQYQARIFDFFERLHPQDKYPGSGIGLATVTKVVSLHGGTVTVASVVGHGSVFSFTVPDRPLSHGRKPTQPSNPRA